MRVYWGYFGRGVASRHSIATAEASAKPGLRLLRLFIHGDCRVEAVAVPLATCRCDLRGRIFGHRWKQAAQLKIVCPFFIGA